MVVRPTITLLKNSASLQKDDCLVDVKVIASEGLRSLISEATNTQTAIYAEDAFSNEAEQLRLHDLFDRHSPPFFYSAKRGLWERLGNVSSGSIKTPTLPSGSIGSLQAKN